MSLFGFGGSSSKSSGSSFDFSQGRSVSSGRSFDAATSGSVGGGTSAQSIAFAPAFADLFATASGRALNAGPSPAGMLFSGGLDFLDRLQGNAGIDALQRRVSGPNTALEGNLQALQERLGRLFSEEINPAITGDAIAGGQLGGGRQGVAQGLGARAIAEQFTQGATSLISDDQAQRDAAAGKLGDLIGGGASTGLGALQSLLGIGMEGQTNLGPLSQLAQILGGPTVLTQASDFSRAFSESLGQSFQDAFSDQFSIGTSQQTSKSKSANFSLF